MRGNVEKSDGFTFVENPVHLFFVAHIYECTCFLQLVSMSP